nr:hypothetical protein StreXyl84_64240 [Streptomyces sp. Xyl84]
MRGPRSTGRPQLSGLILNVAVGCRSHELMRPQHTAGWETLMGSFDVPLDNERTQLDAFVTEYRSALEVTLEGLTEEQVRHRLVSSATTLLGLLKHVTWMQRVWFEECVGGTSRRELGLVQTPDESFQLADDDTIASVTAAHQEACATARAVVADLPLDTVVTGHRAGPRTLRWVYFQVLRELAHHCGHADILREQLLAADER